MKKSLVSVIDLCKYYGDLPAVRGLSFEIFEGEALGLVGPPGAGKSTILRILAGLLTYSSGIVTVLRFDPVLAGNKVWRRVGYFPERLDLFQHTTVGACGRSSARKRGLDVERAFREARDKWDLEDVLGTKILDLSELDRRRGVLWGTCSHELPLLLLDEPLRGLAGQERIEFVELLKETFKGRGGVLASESIADVWDVCDKVLVISGGKPVGTIAIDKTAAEEPVGVATTR